MLEISTSNHLPLAIVFKFTFIRAQPDDGHHDAPKHVVASPITSYIIKSVVVIDCCPHVYIIFTHNGNVKPLDHHLHVPNVLKSENFNLLEPSWPVQACNGISLPLPYCTVRSCPVVLSKRVVRVNAQRAVCGPSRCVYGYGCRQSY